MPLDPFWGQSSECCAPAPFPPHTLLAILHERGDSQQARCPSADLTVPFRRKENEPRTSDTNHLAHPHRGRDKKKTIPQGLAPPPRRLQNLRRAASFYTRSRPRSCATPGILPARMSPEPASLLTPNCALLAPALLGGGGEPGEARVGSSRKRPPPRGLLAEVPPAPWPPDGPTRLGPVVLGPPDVLPPVHPVDELVQRVVVDGFDVPQPVQGQHEVRAVLVVRDHPADGVFLAEQQEGAGR